MDEEANRLSATGIVGYWCVATLAVLLGLWLTFIATFLSVSTANEASSDYWSPAVLSIIGILPFTAGGLQIRHGRRYGLALARIVIRTGLSIAIVSTIVIVVLEIAHPI